MKIRTQVLSIVGLIILTAFPKVIFAEEIIISGNGSDSVSTATNTQSTQTNVQQNNSADISNTADVNANTGNNSASDNTGTDTNITSGSVSVSTLIGNAVNNSVIGQDCCETANESASIVISGNGSGSQNAVNQINNTSNAAQVTQTATITNNIKGTAVTGGNTANNNSHGNVTIQTGNITVNEKIVNSPINKVKVTFAQLIALDTLISIQGNGTDSKNTINFDQYNNTDITINNIADVYNNSIWDLVSGNNEANDNAYGNVSILSGNIIYNSEITNAVNSSVVVVNVCEEKEDGQETPGDNATPPTESNTTTKNENNNTGGSSSGGKGGEVLGASVQNLLPQTGSNWLLLAIFANIVMLFFGVMLRLRAGRSPGFAFA